MTNFTLNRRVKIRAIKVNVVGDDVYKRFPLQYDPLYWGAVFPLGMYAVGTQQMAHAMGFDFLSSFPPFLLSSLPTVFSWIALIAWLLTFYAYLAALFRGVQTQQNS